MRDEFRLDGKTAVITSAGSGIGRAIALKFAANGASARILDVNSNDAESVAKEIIDPGGSASAYTCDVSDQRQIISTFDRIARDRMTITASRRNLGTEGYANLILRSPLSCQRLLQGRPRVDHRG